MQLLEVPMPITNQREADIHSMIDAAMAQVTSGLVSGTYRPPESYPHHVVATEAPLVYPGKDLLDCFDVMNDAFVKAGWSDGMPLVPPTRTKVDAMVKASGRARDEVVGVFEPGLGVGTVEKIAANAVMAGCKPEAMPIVLAAAECILDPLIGLRTLAMSTGPQAPIIFVSGPYAEKIGMNSGCCALGPGSVSKVNIAIGRTLRLLMMNIGHSYPGVSDMDTIGSPLKFSACVAENESRTPWEPFRVAKGFSREETTVTVHAPYGIAEVYDFYNTEPEALARTFAMATISPHAGNANWLVMNPGPGLPGPLHGRYELPIMMAPDHADVFRKAGWSRRQVQEAIFRHARAPFKNLINNKPPEAFLATNPHLQWLWDNPDTQISVFKSPDLVDILVVGAEAGRSLYWYSGSAGATKAVKLGA